MQVNIMSIKEAKESFKNTNIQKTKFIIITSYDNDIIYIPEYNKLLLSFKDSEMQGKDSFNKYLANKISTFLKILTLINTI